MAVKVLLVDDSAMFLDSAEQFLADENGIDVVGRAESVAEALELAARLSPDLVLLDVAMPGTSGFEVSRHLKSAPHPPRVVIVTLYDTAQYRAVAARTADGFIPKDEFGAAIVPLIHALFPTVNEAIRGA